MADEENIDTTLNETAAEIAGRDTQPAGEGADTLAGGAGADAGAPPARPMPKSWAKEYQEVWDGLNDRAREIYEKREADFLRGTEGFRTEAAYAKAFREAIAPYQPLLDSQGIRDHAQAVKFLLNAHYQLSSGQPQERANYFARLAKTYGVDVAQLQAAAAGAAPATDPAVAALNARLDKFEGAWGAEQQARYAALQAQTRKEVEAFASDKAHPYFDEVADDVAALIGAYPQISLKEAYERAVWANPVTRAKEQARLTAESGDALRKKATDEARRAAAARGTAIRGKDSERPADEPKGTMDDTLRETLKEIQNRT